MLVQNPLLESRIPRPWNVTVTLAAAALIAITATLAAAPQSAPAEKPSAGGESSADNQRSSHSAEKPPPQEAAEPQHKEGNPTVAAAPYRIKPFDLINVQVLGALMEVPIDGARLVEPDGQVNLGPGYGRVGVQDMTVDEAEAAITRHLKKLLRMPAVQVTAQGRATKFSVAVLPPPPYRIKPRDSLAIQVGGTPPEQPIDGTFTVEPDGRLPLGPGYGRVQLKAMSLEEAQRVIDQHLRKWLRDPKVGVTLAAWKTAVRDVASVNRPFRIEPGDLLDIAAVGTLTEAPIRATYLVEPDGHVLLGPFYGRTSVKGMTFAEAERAIVEHLKKELRQPEVSVTLGGWKQRPPGGKSNVPEATGG